MATYTYTHKSWGHAVGTWYAEVTESEINELKNTSKITVKFYVKAAHNNQKSETYNNYPAGYGSSTPYSKIYIDGTCVKTVTPACFDLRYNSAKKIKNGTKYDLGTYTKTVTHASDGSKSLKIKCQHYTSVSPGYATCEGTFTCKKIDVHKATALTVPTGTHNIGASITIQAKPKSTSYTHALNVSLDNTNWTNIKNSLKFGTANKNNDYKFTIPTDFKKNIAKQKTGTMYVKLSTWINGNYIGVETKTVKIKNNDQDLRTTTLTVPSGTHNIGSNITVQANPCNTSLKHNLWVSDDNVNWIKLKDQFTLSKANTNNSITFKIPDDFTKNIPAKSSGTMWVWLATFNNGTRIGYENKTVKIYNNYEKTKGTFNFSSKMKKTNDKYLFSNNKKIITDLNVTWDYMPYSVYYEISGPNAYAYVKSYSVDYERGSADNTGDWYILWKDQAQGSGYHQYTSPTLPSAGTYKIKVTVNDGRQTTTGGPSPQFTKTISIDLKNPSLTINSLTIDNGFTYVKDGKYITGKSNPKADVSFYTDSKVKSCTFELTGANKATVSVKSSELSGLAAGKTHKLSGMLGTLSKAGSNTLKVTVTSTTGQTASKTMTFQSYEEDKYLSIKDSYIDNSLAKNLINDKYYVGQSRLGLKIKIKHSHTLKKLTLTIDGKSYDLKSYMYNNASYTCPEVLSKAGDCKVVLKIEDINGLTDTKTMTVFVNEDTSAPKCPVIKFEYKHPRRPHRHFYFCEGEHIIFTGTSSDIEDYQIIYALAPCDVFNAFSKYNSDNSYADADSDDLSDRLEENISDDIRYYIWKDFGEGEYSRPICKHPSQKNTFRLYEVAPDHDAHEEYFALQWFEHAEPGDALFLYIRERKKKVTATATSEEYIYCDEYEYNNIPKEKLFPVCVLPPMPSQIQLYEKSRDKNKMVIEYLNPIYNLDLGVKNPIHLIDICLIAKDKNGKIINGSENKKRDGKHGRSWVYYSDRKWHSIVPWKYSQVNNKETFTMEFDVSQYGQDAIIYVVAFYYNDFYRHPSIYSTSNVLQSESKDLDFNLAFAKPENNSSVNTPNPLVQVKMIPKITDEDALMESIYSDINFCKHWHKYRAHWHKMPIWLHHWPRKHDRCFPHFHVHDLYYNNCFYKTFTDCPHHRIEHHHHHRHHYHYHHPCWKIPDRPDTDESTVSYNECCLFLSCGDKEIELGDVNIDELQNEERLFEWVQDSTGTFLKPGANKISAYTYPYDYKEETKNEIEAPNGYWHNRCNFICHPIMKCHPHHYRDIIIRPKHILNWFDIERDIIKFKIPYRRLIPNHEYVLTFKTFTDEGFFYPINKIFQVPYKKDEDDDLICGAFLDINVHHDSILVNLDYEKRFIVYRPAYHILDRGLHRPCINHYKKEILHTIKFKAPSATSHFPWDRFFDIVVKARGVHKVKIFSTRLRDVTSKTEEDVTVNKSLNRAKKEHEVSINVNYDFKLEMKDLNYINPMSNKDQMSLRNYLLNIASECGITNVQPGWRNYNSSSYLMARDFNDVKDYCYNLFSAIKTKYSTTFRGNPDLFKNLPTIVVGDKRGPNTFSNRGMHYFPEWDDLIDAIKKQTFGEYIPNPEPEFIKCTGINIIPDRIPIPQNGKIGDQYQVDYEVFPSNCMEEVTWVMESTKFVNVNDGIMTRTVEYIDTSSYSSNGSLESLEGKPVDKIIEEIDHYKGRYTTVGDTNLCVSSSNKSITSLRINLKDFLANSNEVIVVIDHATASIKENLKFGELCFFESKTSAVRVFCDLKNNTTPYGTIYDISYINGGAKIAFYANNTALITLLKQYPYVTVSATTQYNELEVADVITRIDHYGRSITNGGVQIQPIEINTKVIAKCGSYSDSAVVYVEPSKIENDFEITAFTIDNKNALGLSKPLSIEAKSSCPVKVTIGKSYYTLTKMIIRITGANTQTITTTKFTNQTYANVTANMSRAGTDNWTVEVYDTEGNVAIAKSTTKTSIYDEPTVTTPPKYPCTGLNVGGSITVKEGAISIGTNIPGTIGFMYPTYTPINCTDRPTESSSNSSVAEAMCTNFLNGKITVRVAGYKAGSCTITIRMGNYSGSFNVTVTK